MAGRLQQTEEELSFRFFTSQEVDRILVEGARRGRAGSHAAIERILKHEVQLERPELWQRIRQLRRPALRTCRRRPIWNHEDEEVLCEGYRNGWRGKREAVRELLRRHADWRPHTVWRHAAKLGLVDRKEVKGQDRTHLAWSAEDDGILLDLAGYKSARAIAKQLHRSEAAVRSRLCILGKSSRLDSDGFSRHALARDLHLSSRTVQKLIVEGLLEVRDPRITRKSLDHLPGTNGSPDSICDGEVASHPSPEPVRRGEVTVEAAPKAPDTDNGAAASNSSSRAKRAWGEVASRLGASLTAVEQLIIRGKLKMYDPTILEKSLRNFCRRYGSVINADVLDHETRDWLESVMGFDPHAGQSVAERLKSLRKHALIVRRCKCGRPVRGNAYFRHARKCEQAQERTSDRNWPRQDAKPERVTG